MKRSVKKFKKEWKQRLPNLFYFCSEMKILLVFVFFLVQVIAQAQCSICAKTAQQLGEGPADGMNTGILYLAFTPFLIVGYIGYRWWKKNRQG